MKSYTDIEQSKKLAKILPLESADMHYVLIDSDQETYSPGLGKYYGVLPSILCWSLTGLLSVLPTGKVLLHDKGNHGYKCICNNIDSYYFNNPVDACVAMIERLHELKIL